MRSLLWLLPLLGLACAASPEPTRPAIVYAPSSVHTWSAHEGVRQFPAQGVPPIVFDRIHDIAGAYVDLITLSKLTDFEGELEQPGGELSVPGSGLKLIGQAQWDWPVLVARKDLDLKDLRTQIGSGQMRLLGQPGEGPSLYLPVRDELTLVRLLEQWRVWSPSLSVFQERSLTDLGYVPLSSAVAKADVSLLMRSQWETLKREQTANVVVYEDLKLVPMPGETVVAPWGLVSTSSKPLLESLAQKLELGPPLPADSRLSALSQSKARLLAHQLYPQKFGRKSVTKVSWVP